MTEEEVVDLRHCLGRYATGITVVTCQGDRGPCGITANSFSSVSLDPPLVLWNIAKVTQSLRAYLAAEYFAIHVLGADQRQLSHHFAQSDHTVFSGIDYEMSERDVPILPGTIACFECRTSQVHECGDHYIIIGEVEKFRASDGEPLLFYGGEYYPRGDKVIS